LAETIAKTRNVPFVTANSCSITEAGYISGDVEDMLLMSMVTKKQQKKASFILMKLIKLQKVLTLEKELVNNLFKRHF